MSTILSSLLSLRWFTLGDGLPAPAQHHALQYPLSPQPRIAALGFEFLPEPDLKCLPAWSLRSLESAAPEALAAPPSDLLIVALMRKQGVLRLNRLKYPLLALLRPGQHPLSDAQIQELYRHFGLPVRQQFRDHEGRLLAQDCEAGAGFHILQPGFPLPGGVLTHTPCPCGHPAPRLLTPPLARAATGIL
ncbi:MAG: hypothetical protein M9913_23745 [Bryobacteraceae bacterium]|nr:hypothetical protein [Solibacteraceae bacterium]MCO5353849.1 hypothetical protein [Bryobacteraceae bacterium]